MRARTPGEPETNTRLHRGTGVGVRGHPDHCPGVHERGVQCGERGLLRGHDSSEPAFEEPGIVLDHVGDVLDPHPGRWCMEVRELPVVASVDEDEAGGGAAFRHVLAGTAGGRGAGGGHGEVERAPLDGGYVRVLPVLVARRGKARARECVDACAAHAAEPPEMMTGERRLALGEGVDVPGGRGRGVVHAPGAVSRTHSKPRDSSSRARSRPPETVMRPPLRTWTRSGTMKSSMR